MALEIKEYVGHTPKKVDEQKFKAPKQKPAVKKPPKRPVGRGK